MITGAFSAAYLTPTTPFTVALTGFRNPRTTVATSTFEIYTYDATTYAISALTSGITLTMTTQATLTSMTVAKASNVNGETNVYTFTVTSPIPHYDTDKLTFTFPDDVVGPASTTCTEITNVLTVVCTIPGANKL